jgi:Carboxypeptidase regulatory-like domain
MARSSVLGFATRRRAVAATLCAGLVAALSGQTQASRDRVERAGHRAQGASAAEGLIVGRVVEGLSATPVIDAVVDLVGDAGRMKLTSLTDADGDFVFFHLPPGSYDLTANKAGCWPGSFGERRPNGGRRLVVLTAGQVGAEVRLVRTWLRGRLRRSMGCRCRVGR